MKRLKPDAYKIEARRRIDQATKDLIARFGAWNAEKIASEMERVLRDKRRANEHAPV